MSLACKWYSRKIAWCPNCSGQLISCVCLHTSLQKNNLINSPGGNWITYFSNWKETLASQKMIPLPEDSVRANLKSKHMTECKYSSMLTNNIWEHLITAVSLCIQTLRHQLDRRFYKIQRNDSNLKNLEDF